MLSIKLSRKNRAVGATTSHKLRWHIIEIVRNALRIRESTVVEFIDYLYDEGDLLLRCKEDWNHQTSVQQEERIAFGAHIAVRAMLDTAVRVDLVARRIVDDLRYLAQTDPESFGELHKHGFFVTVTNEHVGTCGVTGST